MPFEVFAHVNSSEFAKICFSFFPNGELRASWEVNSHATKLSKFVHGNSKHPVTCFRLQSNNSSNKKIATLTKEYSLVA